MLINISSSLSRIPETGSKNFVIRFGFGLVVKNNRDFWFGLFGFIKKTSILVQNWHGSVLVFIIYFIIN